MNTQNDNNNFYTNNDKILFIKGINILDIMDGLNKYISINDTHNDFDYNKQLNSQYDKISKKYYNYSAWETNNIVCWYCTLMFNNKPIFIPVSISKDSMEIMGNFCSFGCACKYVNIYYKHNDTERYQYINHLKYLYKNIYNKTISIIQESPDKELLTKFGGNMSVLEYKNKITI